MIPNFKSKKKTAASLTPSQKLRLKILELREVKGSVLSPESFYEFKIDFYIEEIQKEIDKIKGFN